MPDDALLPHLAATARAARIVGGLTYAHVAVHVHKRSGRTGVSESTIARFEYGDHWPENPDAVIGAYAEALGLPELELWRVAIAALRDPAIPPPIHPKGTTHAQR